MKRPSDFAARLCELIAEASDAVALRDGLAALVAPTALLAERGGPPAWTPVGTAPDLPGSVSTLALGRWGRLTSSPAVISRLDPFAAALAKAFDRCERSLPRRVDDPPVAERRATPQPAPPLLHHDAVLLTDPDGRIQMANRAFVDFFAPDGGLPDALADLADCFGNPGQFLAWAARAVQAPSGTDALELPLDDDKRQVELTCSLLKDRAGRPQARLLLIRDAARTSAVDQVKAEFINVVSHELRTPLTSVLGFAELVLTRDLSADKLRQYVSTIYEEGKRLSVLLDDFLDINRLESRRQSYNMQELEVRTLLDKAASLFGSSDKHRLEVQTPVKLPSVNGDPDRLMQCLSNLVSNAVKYSPNGGRIWLSAEPSTSGQNLIVRVRDEGLGMPEAALGNLFRKFYRVHRPEWQGIGGTGLGLAICREIIRAHGGEIWCESREGVGSIFSFTLPVLARRRGAPRRRPGKVPGESAAAD